MKPKWGRSKVHKMFQLRKLRRGENVDLIEEESTGIILKWIIQEQNVII
jgi:hypothetical protein